MHKKGTLVDQQHLSKHCAHVDVLFSCFMAFLLLWIGLFACDCCLYATEPNSLECLFPLLLIAQGLFQFLFFSGHQLLEADGLVHVVERDGLTLVVESIRASAR